MSDFRICFRLKPAAEIIPWGENGDYLSWFGLTDSELWITVGEQTIYEYSDAARKEWKCGIRHNDYQLSRFLEDFSETFRFVRESVPREYYDHIDEFVTDSNNWQTLYLDDDSIDDDSFIDFLEEKWEPLTSWLHDRVFDSGHLTGGPLVGCFRCKDMIKIRWNSDYLLDNGESIWTAPSGEFEIPYTDFVFEVKRFFREFYTAMDKQVETALRMDWGKVKLDKTRLAEEHKERKEGFDREIALLDEEFSATDWEKVREMYEVMKRESESISD